MGLVDLLVVLNHLPWHPDKFHEWWTYCWSEVSLVFLRCKFIYTHLFHCTIKTPKLHWTLKRQRYPIYMFTATPGCQISLQVHQMILKWPWTLRDQTLHIKLGFIDIRVDFRNCHIWAWYLAISKRSRGCTYNLTFYSTCLKLSLIFALRAVVSEIQDHCQNCHKSSNWSRGYY